MASYPRRSTEAPRPGGIFTRIQPVSPVASGGREGPAFSSIYLTKNGASTIGAQSSQVQIQAERSTQGALNGGGSRVLAAGSQPLMSSSGRKLTRPSTPPLGGTRDSNERADGASATSPASKPAR